MLNVRLAMAVHLAVGCDVFDGVFLCCLFSHWTSWMRSGTLLSQFLRVFLPTIQLALNWRLYDWQIQSC